jgi:hypothetical protein
MTCVRLSFNTVLFFALIAALSCADSGTPRQTGLLLGLAERGSKYESSDRLSTRFITYDGTAARELASIDRLVVPHGSRLWQIAVIRMCSADQTFDEPRVHCADSLWVSAETVAPPQARLRDDPCTTYSVHPDFVSPELLSLTTYSWESDCAQRSWSDVYGAEVRRHGVEGRIPFGQIGRNAKAAYTRAANVAAYTRVEDARPVLQDRSCATNPDDDTAWHITRKADRWVAELLQQQGNELCVLKAEIDWELDAQVLGSTEATVDWAAITRTVPDAKQVFRSPGGELAIVVLPSVIRIYAARGGIPTESLVEYARADVVMVQWADTRTAAMWDTLLARVRVTRSPSRETSSRP